MELFRWISDQAMPPWLDLRRVGWSMIQSDDADDACDCLRIMPRWNDGDHSPQLSSAICEITMVAGVNDTRERARLLGLGFGDAIGDAVTLVELGHRARRLAQSRYWLPRKRTIAALELDLLTRDAMLEGRAIGLKPKEFEILWRLADVPEKAVSRQELVEDVLGLNFEPLSNTITVHMSRLRGKLRQVQLHDMLETISGGYRLRMPAPQHRHDVLPSVTTADPRFS